MLKPPLILTLAIDPIAFEYFNTLRQQHFPPARNYLDAHLTLFHALPNEAAIIDVVKATTSLQTTFVFSVVEPVSIGRGVAFKIVSKELVQLHKNFHNAWHQSLTPQDKQTIWPHITVQNKVTTQQAQTLLAALKKDFTPFEATATGLQLWVYMGGPWRRLHEFGFTKLKG